MVGLKILTDDGNGHEIIPTAQIVFAFGAVTGANHITENVEREFDLSPSMARDLAARLLEFCDSAEKIDKAAAQPIRSSDSPSPS